MDFPEVELEEIILGVLDDCAVVSPPLDRNEIAQHVVDHVSADLRKSVYAALDRMVGRGVVVKLRDPGEDRSCRYSLAPGPAGCH